MKYLLIIFLSICCLRGQAQTVTGKLIDKTTKQPLSYIFVTASSGSAFTKDDGTFSLNITNFADTIRIKTMGYKAYKFPASRWGNFTKIIELEPRPLLLNEVNISAKRNYLKDSLNTRKQFAKEFAYTGPHLKDVLRPTASNVPFAFVTLDVGMLVGLLTKKKSPGYKLKQELLRDEQEKHVSQRFNKSMVGRVSQLKGDSLEFFMSSCRPTPAMLDKLSDYQLILYIKDNLKTFKTEKGKATELQPRFGE